MFNKKQPKLEHIEHLDLREDSETLNSVAVLEPEPPAESVMNRAKSVITPFGNDSDVEQLDADIARLAREQRSLYGLESHASVALGARIAELAREQRIAKAYIRHGGSKLRLSNEVLTWRKDNPAQLGTDRYIPLPEVALFGLDSNVMHISSNWPSPGGIEPQLPIQMARLYKDVLSAMENMSRGTFHSYSFRIFAAFSGIIPAGTKEKIREARESDVFSQIRVLAEAEWAVDVVPSPHYADPIVVGLVEDEMWVIDIFDPTPLEDYIAKEFTT